MKTSVYDSVLRPALVAIGNNRLPYIIAINEFWPYQDIASMHISYAIIHAYDFITIQELAIKAKDADIVCLIYNDIKQLINVLPVLNEIYSTSDDVMHDDLDDFIRQTFDVRTKDEVLVRKHLNFDFVAFDGNKCKIINEQFKSWEPWHVAMYHIPTNTIMQVIWDSREILAMHTATDSDLELLRKQKHVNDNRFLLFNRSNSTIKNQNNIIQLL
jgi:hypothetical protein